MRLSDVHSLLKRGSADRTFENRLRVLETSEEWLNRGTFGAPCTRNRLIETCFKLSRKKKGSGSSRWRSSCFFYMSVRKELSWDNLSSGRTLFFGTVIFHRAPPAERSRKWFCTQSRHIWDGATLERFCPVRHTGRRCALQSVSYWASSYICSASTVSYRVAYVGDVTVCDDLLFWKKF